MGVIVVHKAASVSKMTNAECRMNDQPCVGTPRGAPSLPADLVIRDRPVHRSCRSNPFQFGDSHGQTTHLVWPIGFQNCYAQRLRAAY